MFELLNPSTSKKYKIELITLYNDIIKFIKSFIINIAKFNNNIFKIILSGIYDVIIKEADSDLNNF